MHTVKLCNKYIVIILSILSYTVSSCVDNSAKIKELQAQIDSLQGTNSVQKDFLEEVFAALNELENGLRNIRQAENILSVEAERDGINLSDNQKEKMRTDITAIQNAIENYKQKIEELKKDNNLKSVEFKKRLNAIQSELNEKSTIVSNLYKELENREIIITEKENHIQQLDSTIANLEENITSLENEGENLKTTIANQEKEIRSAYYIAGTKDELIKVGVLSKGGIFRTSKVSYQAEKNAFIKIDYTQISTINTNSTKAKILSNHPKGTYAIESVDNEAIITISDPELFWEHTKYLVIQVQ